MSTKRMSVLCSTNIIVNIVSATYVLREIFSGYERIRSVRPSTRHDENRSMRLSQKAPLAKQAVCALYNMLPSARSRLSHHSIKRASPVVQLALSENPTPGATNIFGQHGSINKAFGESFEIGLAANWSLWYSPAYIRSLGRASTSNNSISASLLTSAARADFRTSLKTRAASSGTETANGYV